MYLVFLSHSGVNNESLNLISYIKSVTLSYNNREIFICTTVLKKKTNISNSIRLICKFKAFVDCKKNHSTECSKMH